MPLATMLYPNGSIYFGQLNRYQREGAGKLIHYNGSFYEGSFQNDHVSGPCCKHYDAERNDVYIGQLV